MAIKRERLTDMLGNYKEKLGDELMAEIGVKILEMDDPDPDTSELDRLKADLEAERAGRAEEKKNYTDIMNRFIYNGIRPDEKPPEGPPTAEQIQGVETETVDDADFMALMYE